MKLRYLINILFLTAISVWIAVFSIDENLHIIACDVGQGDAILIQHKSNQILIDGGPDGSVLSCLGKHMPFWDKDIELVILTHPQLDHYGGLIDVFKSYKVSKFMEHSTNSSSETYRVLKNTVGGKDVTTISGQLGTVIRLGLIHLDILSPIGRPMEPTSIDKSNNLNDDGLVILLNYAQFSALFTADVENRVSDELSKNKKIQSLDYIKVNHHGSKNGMSGLLLDAVNPKLAVISAGKNNKYGHPHKEILDMLGSKNLKILRTDEMGDVEIVTNGLEFWAKN